MTKRKKQRRAKTKAKPLARPGVPIFSGVVGIVVDTPDGPQPRFFWWADERKFSSLEEWEQNAELHGPLPAPRHRKLQKPQSSATNAR
jgi:hypothetical protein